MERLIAMNQVFDSSVDARFLEIQNARREALARKAKKHRENTDSTGRPATLGKSYQKQKKTR